MHSHSPNIKKNMNKKKTILHAVKILKNIFHNNENRGIVDVLGNYLSLELFISCAMRALQ